MGLLADGHVLLEDYPGLAKTLTARSFAQVTSTGFNRIQFTPDLMPADVTGSSIWNQRDADFHFRPGPIFTNLLLADEINRAPPKTQAALLEAMQERQVTIEGVTHPLARPFLVLATQNPIEYEGTYPLPEAQLDRFLLRVSLRLPEQERRVGGALAPARAARGRGRARSGDRRPDAARAAGRDRARPRRRVRRRLHRRARLGDAHQQLDRGRREPARQPRRAQARALQGRAGGARLRHPGRREGRRRAGARAPADAEAGALGAAGLRRRRRPRGARAACPRPPPKRPHRQRNDALGVAARDGVRGARGALPLRRARDPAARAGGPRGAVRAAARARAGARAAAGGAGLAHARAADRARAGRARARARRRLGAAGRAARAPARPPRRASRSSPGERALSLRLGWEDERTIALRLRCARWGNYQVGDLRLRARDRLGLLGWEAQARPADAPARLPAPRDAARDRRARLHAAVRGQRGRAAEGRRARVRRPARVRLGRSRPVDQLAGERRAATCSSSTSAIRSGTPT